MKNTTELPCGYEQILQIDLQKDKKSAIIVNALAVVIAVVMLVAGHLYVPITKLFSFDSGMVIYFARLGAMLIGLLAYVILHELVHGIYMKGFSGMKVRYGFTGLYAYAGSDAYFKKSSYIIIAMAPIVSLGIVLAVLNGFVGTEWFWVVFFIQVSNVAGAAGDLYVIYKMLRLPNDILVQDSGVAMKIFSAQKAVQ